DRSEIPALTDLSTALKDYKGGEAVAQGEAFDPSSANVRKRTIEGQLGNGMKLVFVPKKTRGNTVHADIALHFGDLNTLKGRTAAAVLTPSMLMRGTQKHTRTQIQDELSRLKARVSPMAMGASALRFRIETTKPNLPAVMKLVSGAAGACLR
ncbi:MAG: insulinase family protein, partial [Bryobacteraceae bacterium]